MKCSQKREAESVSETQRVFWQEEPWQNREWIDQVLFLVAVLRVCCTWSWSALYPTVTTPAASATPRLTHYTHTHRSIIQWRQEHIVTAVSQCTSFDGILLDFCDPFTTHTTSMTSTRIRWRFSTAIIGNTNRERSVRLSSAISSHFINMPVLYLPYSRDYILIPANWASVLTFKSRLWAVKMKRGERVCEIKNHSMDALSKRLSRT